MIYFWDLYYNHCVLEPLGHELHTNIKSNALKNYTCYVCLLKFSNICSLVATQKIIKIYKVILNYVSYLFIL
jgi:hypothetical protein